MADKLLDVACKKVQECLKESPVIVIGSGASIPAGLPSMDDIATHIKSSISVEGLSSDDQKLWNQFIENLECRNLENALQETKLSNCLLNRVVRQTWEIVNKADKKVLDRLLDDRNYLPLTMLYNHLFNSTNRTISVVTTNYDRLAEYAADAGGYCHYTGFSYGYLRQRQTDTKLRILQGKNQSRTIDVWKVHGCLDWFMKQDNSVLAVTSVETIPLNHHPALVTPGANKYENTHMEPFRSIITGADTALAKAKSYLCLGFGFNDLHIQPKLKERWELGNAYLVVITKELSESARNMLKGANSGQRFLALEECGSGTRMWSDKYPEGKVLEGIQLWNLAGLVKYAF